MHFSWWIFLVPALSHVFGAPVLVACLAKSALTMVSTGGVFLWGIPTFFASLTLSRYSRWRTVTIALLSIVIFVLYHKFSIASIYSALWLLPLVIASFGLRGTFVGCLEATFVAHAIGTLLYLPVVVTNDAFWVSLLPVALAERLFIAVLMYASCVLFAKISSKLEWPPIRVLRGIIQKI